VFDRFLIVSWLNSLTWSLKAIQCLTQIILKTSSR
jgi:hypothetical protein